MSWVPGFLVVLLIVALVGHGLWLLGRSLLRGARAIVGRGDPRPVEAAMCPRCGEAWAVGSGVRRCPACGWPGPTPRHGRSQSQITIGLLLQRLQRYRRAGLLPDEVGDRVLRGLAEERDRLLVWQVDEAAMGPAAVAGPTAPAAAAPEEAGPPPVREEPREYPPPRPVVADRARVYRDAREAERLHPPAAEEPEPRRRPRLGGLLAAFMEERNIRWGELVGGLLIVGCSLALVVGYWERIAERPVLRFGLANGAVAAFFAVGLYADRRWRLPTTAHGLLMIATLLVPLSVLAIVSARGPAGVGPALLGGELVALGGFAALIGLAGRSTGSATPWATAAGVAVPSAAILAAGRWAAPGISGYTLAAIGAVPLLAHAGATLRGVLDARRRDELDEAAADDLLRTLGLIRLRRGGRAGRPDRPRRGDGCRAAAARRPGPAGRGAGAGRGPDSLATGGPVTDLAPRRRRVDRRGRHPGDAGGRGPGLAGAGGPRRGRRLRRRGAARRRPRLRLAGGARPGRGLPVAGGAGRRPGRHRLPALDRRRRRRGGRRADLAAERGGAGLDRAPLRGRGGRGPLRRTASRGEGARPRRGDGRPGRAGPGVLARPRRAGRPGRGDLDLRRPGGGGAGRGGPDGPSTAVRRRRPARGGPRAGLVGVGPVAGGAGPGIRLPRRRCLGPRPALVRRPCSATRPSPPPSP